MVSLLVRAALKKNATPAESSRGDLPFLSPEISEQTLEVTRTQPQPFILGTVFALVLLRIRVLGLAGARLTSEAVSACSAGGLPPAQPGVCLSRPWPDTQGGCVCPRAWWRG